MPTDENDVLENGTDIDTETDVNTEVDADTETDTDTEQNPEVWVVTLPSGNQYFIRDDAARQAIDELRAIVAGVMHFRGRTLTELYDGATTSPIILVDDPTHPYVPQNGDVVTYRPDPDTDSDSDTDPIMELEFAWTGHHWQEYGSSGALKALAFKDTASTPYTPQGTISNPTFTGNEATISVAGTPQGSINAQAFTGTEATIGVAGTAEAQVFTGHPVDYTPAGVNTGANVTLTHDTVNSITDVGTLPVLPTFTVSNGQLIITGGSPGTLPTKGADQTVAVDVDTITQPTFTGTLAQITAEGENATSAVSASGQYTPEGGIEQAEFTGQELTSTGQYTPTGSNATPTFTGTPTTITVS